ncbi:MAG: cell division protein ZipA C-terminal FtsZ-binding domain-containing protein [Cycloclasticus sp.]
MEESSLRLILLIVGVFILLGIYYYDVLQKKKAIQEDGFEHSLNRRVDPVVETDSDFSAVYEEQQIQTFVEDTRQKELKESDFTPTLSDDDVPVAEQIPVVQLAVLPIQGQLLGGKDLLDAFTQLNLEFGDMGIFHRYERYNGVETQQFHVANILEPGTFPVGSMNDFESTGIVLFFQASDMANPEEAFENMLDVARQLSQCLKANLVDAEMKELVPEKIVEIQSRLAPFSPR